MPATIPPAAADRLIAVALDEATIGRRRPEVEHERAVAIYDLLEANRFVPTGHAERGPFALTLSLNEARLVLAIMTEQREPLVTHILSLTPFKRIVREYQRVCESYYDAIKGATLAQIEAIDMGRRGLHNEGSELLRQRLAGKVELDQDTSRRLFTLVCALLST